MEFKLINQSRQSAALFEKHPAWASYFEPRDIDAIEKWGVNREDIIKQLEVINYSDDYIFPLLSLENERSFKLEYYKATLTMPSGEVLSGYTIGTRLYAIGIFTKSGHYILNLYLKDCMLEDEQEILNDIGSKAKTLFPLKINVDVMGLHLSGEFKL